jgi:molybdopterin converting factor small subunit
MISFMTKLLEQAIAKARELSESEQDAIADALFAHLASEGDRVRLTPEQVADVTRIREDLRSGRTRLATDEEMSAFWKKCGL